MTAISTNLMLPVFLVIFISLFLFSYGISQVIRTRANKRQLIGKIKAGGHRMPDISDNYAVDSATTPAKGSFFGIFGRISKAALPEAALDYSSMRLRFLRAGIRQENAPINFWGVKIFLVVFLPLLFLIVRFYFYPAINYQLTMAIGIFCALLGFYFPDIWLLQKTQTRKEKVLHALPDALDLLVICVEAGMGIDSAINRVANETKINNPELSEEFHLMGLELRAGKQRKDALRNLALRTNLDEVNSLATLLIQTDQFGTSMADALRVYSDSYRTQRFQRAEELAAKLPVKLLFPLVAFIFPAMFVVLLGPAGLAIYHGWIAK